MAEYHTLYFKPGVWEKLKIISDKLGVSASRAIQILIEQYNNK